MALTDVKIRNTKPKPKPFKIADGGGLYLLIKPDGARYWRLDYRFAGKRRTLACGIYPTTTLASARKRRDDARTLLADGLDPSAEKKSAKREANLVHQNTFEIVAREWLDKQRKRLALRYCALLQARLEDDIFPALGAMPITDIDAPRLLESLRKVEQRGAVETALRLRQLCGTIFRYAIATGRAQRDPSADLKGALASPGRTRGHKAMPMAELPSFLTALSLYDGDPRTRLALRLMILTFVRTTELRAAQWSEFENLDGAEPLWRIPASRMKMGVEHLVPLSAQAVAVLRELRALPGSDASPFLFPSPSREGYMSNNTMLFAVYRMGFHNRTTVHGIRSLASTYLNEAHFPADHIEAQLAHQTGSAVRRAYNRAQYLPERRTMMNRWADIIDAKAREIVIQPKG